MGSVRACSLQADNRNGFWKGPAKWLIWQKNDASGSACWVQVPRTSCVSSGKLRNLSVPWCLLL